MVVYYNKIIIKINVDMDEIGKSKSKSIVLVFFIAWIRTNIYDYVTRNQWLVPNKGHIKCKYYTQPYSKPIFFPIGPILLVILKKTKVLVVDL